jgi:hypothetical protein
LGEKNLKISLTLGRKCPKTFSDFERKIFLKLSLILRENICQIFSSIGEKTLLTFLSFRRQFLMSFSQFLEAILNELSPILETVSDQFSSILKIVSGEFSSFFGGSFCNMNFPTFRKVSKSSNVFNESHNDPIGQ